jgi:peptide/nickel transport system substrate-binding protein
MGTKRVVVAIRGAPSTFALQRTNPPGTGGSIPGTDALEELLQAGLVHRNDQDLLVPQLTEAVPTLDNGLWRLLPDGRMETTHRIREGVRWHDGTPLTTADLLFAMQLEQDRELALPANNVYDLIEHVTATDAQTMVVTWRQPYVEADALFSYEVALPTPKHLLEGYLDNKAAFFDAPYWTHEVVGAGPYKLHELVLDSYVVLRANESYILGRPKIDEIEMRFISDSNALMTNILAGVELTVGRALSLEQGMQVADQWRTGKVALRTGGWARMTPQFINPSPPVVGDVRFRRALLHALDRQQMVDGLLAGRSSVADGFVSPDQPEYADVASAIVRYPYDPRQAAEMIQELGFSRAADGFFLGANGQRLTVELRSTVLNDLHAKIMAPVGSQWQQIGVAVDQQMISIQQFQDRSDRGREYRATYPAFELIALGNRLSPKDLYVYHSSAAPTPENRFLVGGNIARYQSPEMDALIERYATTIPRAERNQVLAQIVHHQTDRVTQLGLVFNVNPTMVADRLQNVRARSNRATEAWNVHEWDVAA